MSEPVATPNTEPELIVDVKEKSATDEGAILDEGLDIAGYRATHDSPFAADYFGLKHMYKTNPEIAQQVDTVTEYLIKETEGESIVFAAKSLLDQISDEMNLQDKDTGLYRIKKVLGMINAKQKMKALETLRGAVLEDIEKMV
ncbi:MAG: hypothetical protein DRP09_10935 [Candidatus Thorarchaeota archaeon]|nr:MAG: hypothetical protein DRP09_10935 [Candidatus Thorarchaeota archaeon]